jgi:hypothetical protein
MLTIFVSPLIDNHDIIAVTTKTLIPVAIEKQQQIVSTIAQHSSCENLNSYIQPLIS